MCRLFAVTSETPQSPILALKALDGMREGHDGSGVGLFMTDLGGPFEDLKDCPILSGIFTNQGMKRLDEFMMELGFMTKYKLSIKVPKTPPPDIPKRDMYLIRAYEYPSTWEDLEQSEIPGVGSGRTSSPNHFGPGTPEHQLRHQPVCVPSLFRPRGGYHDQRRKHGFYTYTGISRLARISWIYGVSIRLGGLHPHPSLHAEPPGSRH